ncbi:MAG: radical SAM family heme chaperone HemW [Actinomycetota bacterium]|nr:radical SAM family heme chaperone HemW [Actinomycetota bacterium]
MDATPGPGVYVHVPFCATRCDYCAFATWTDKVHLVDAYVAAVLEEIAAAAEQEDLGPAATVYVGGGTPSLLPPSALCTIIEAIERQDGAEVTVECNPESTTNELMAALADCGVGRISLGVQSTSPRVLASLGRSQHPGSLRRAVSAIADAGIGRYNVDLIYGAADEHDADFAASLRDVFALDPAPSHLSAYALTIEAGTPLARDPHRHPDDDAQARRYILADEAAEAAGLSWYEISNWAVPGHESRHNLDCWRQGDYRGFGCAAHSHRGGRRFWNTVSFERYLAAIREGKTAVAGEERLDASRYAEEALELSLRTRWGVPEGAVSPDDRRLLVEEARLLEPRDDRLVLTRKGRILANEVAVRLRVPEPEHLSAPKVPSVTNR